MNMPIEETIEELYSCLPGDRKKFNMIMENMKKRFLTAKNAKQAKSNQSKVPFQPFQQNNNQKNNFLANNDFSPKNNTNNNLNNKSNPINAFKLNNTNNNIRDSFPSLRFEQNINYNPIKIQDTRNHYNTQRNFYKEERRINDYDNKRNNMNAFKGTIPDALLVSPKPLRTNSQQKLLSDTHANCNFYYPEINNAGEGDIDINGNGWHNQANNIMFNTDENFYKGNKL
jgi:hypothetical protein